MSNIEIRKVETLHELKVFIQFFYDLYRDNPCAVPYLYGEEMKTLRKDKNPAFAFCEADYFLAYHDGKVVGRVAAMINHRANERWKKHMVRFGWLDFIDDIDVCRALLDTVAQWGKDKGMDCIGGPFGFEDMDREGMMVEGFDRLSTLYINYNNEYYPRFMDQLGFRKDNDWVECRIKVPEVTPRKFALTAELVQKRYNLQVRKYGVLDFVKRGKGKELFDIVNRTYDGLYGFSHLSDDQISRLVNDYIRRADLNLVTCVVDANANDRMVGFGVSFPSFSRALQHTRDGRLLPMGWWHLLRVMKWHKTDTVDLLLIAVLPEYRMKGANALIFNDLIGWYRRYGFKWAEAMPQMETNHGVLDQWQYLEAEQHRRHRAYIREIDEPIKKTE